MNISELTTALQEFTETSRDNLVELLREPIREYLEALLGNPNLLAAIMHTSGSEADEAVRMSNALEGIEPEQLANEVADRLVDGIISTTLVPAVLPTPLLSSTNQALLAALRERAEEG